MAEDDTAEPVETTWASVTATLLVSGIQGLVFFVFFLVQRNKHMTNTTYELFEPRQFTRSHRSPAPFEGGGGVLSWARAAYRVSDEDCLKFVGLDTFMFLRFIRLGARITFLGTMLSVILIPVYATGEARGIETESFNKLTLARVGINSSRLWATLLCEFIFIAFILRSFWTEWELYAKHRYAFLAYGDVDTPEDFRYACIVENLPRDLQSNRTLRDYFERLFPNQVQQVSVCLVTTKLDNLVKVRRTKFVAFEKAVAFIHAKPDKPVPTVREGSFCIGEKREAIPFLQSEIEVLNIEIDWERNRLLSHMTSNEEAILEESNLEVVETTDSSDCNQFEIGLSSKGSVVVGDKDLKPQKTEDLQEANASEEPTETGQTCSTAFITFTSLRSKQTAIQVEISGTKDKVDVFPASEPAGVLWGNVTTNLTKQRISALIASCFWIVGILFWAVPVTFVISVANINSILQVFNLEQSDPSRLWYGIVSGLLPVIALQVLMIVLYMSIVGCATHFVRLKSMPEVDSYALYWNQLFQFANLWLILIGGSVINQVDSIIKDPDYISKLIAAAMPGVSVFFINFITVGSWGSFGLQLSLLPTYGVTLIMNMIQPEAQRTQRMLDNARRPPSLIWGKQLPGMVFVFLVSVLYFPIVPIMDLFALAYFCGHYVVFKHQCLHVYAQEFEGGGTATWQCIFGFLMAAIYMSELVFITYMGLKEAPVQSALGFIPLVVTMHVHRLINRNIRMPLQHLSMEVAADVDIKEGLRTIDPNGIGNFESAIEKQLYAQPSLKKCLDEREPMPYRRDVAEEMEKASLIT